MLRKKLSVGFMALIASLILAGPAMALTGAKGPGTTGEITNTLTAIAPLGNFLTGAYLQVTLLDTNGLNPGQPQITFPTGIDTANGPVFYNANQIIGIQYDNLQSAGSELGLLFYSDNSNALASYQYKGSPNASHGGLIGQDNKSVVPLVFSLYKEVRAQTTNYRAAYGVGSYSAKPWAPTNYAGWSNKAPNGYDYDGYFTWLSDITDPGYTWHTVGSNSCSLVNNIGAATFDQAKQSPSKGNLQTAPATKTFAGGWLFNGPFGGWVTINKYDNNWVHYNNPAAPQLVGSKNDCFVYLAANFKGKPIQNYKTSKLVVEVYSNP